MKSAYTKDLQPPKRQQRAEVPAVTSPRQDLQPPKRQLLTRCQKAKPTSQVGQRYQQRAQSYGSGDSCRGFPGFPVPRRRFNKLKLVVFTISCAVKQTGFVHVIVSSDYLHTFCFLAYCEILFVYVEDLSLIYVEFGKPCFHEFVCLFSQDCFSVQDVCRDVLA